MSSKNVSEAQPSNRATTSGASRRRPTERSDTSRSSVAGEIGNFSPVRRDSKGKFKSKTSVARSTFQISTPTVFREQVDSNATASSTTSATFSVDETNVSLRRKRDTGGKFVSSGASLSTSTAQPSVDLSDSLRSRRTRASRDSSVTSHVSGSFSEESLIDVTKPLRSNRVNPNTESSVSLSTSRRLERKRPSSRSSVVTHVSQSTVANSSVGDESSGRLADVDGCHNLFAIDGTNAASVRPDGDDESRLSRDSFEVSDVGSNQRRSRRVNLNSRSSVTLSTSRLDQTRLSRRSSVTTHVSQSTIASSLVDDESTREWLAGIERFHNLPCIEGTNAASVRPDGDDESRPSRDSFLDSNIGSRPRRSRRASFNSRSSVALSTSRLDQTRLSRRSSVLTHVSQSTIASSLVDDESTSGRFVEIESHRHNLPCIDGTNAASVRPDGDDASRLSRDSFSVSCVSGSPTRSLIDVGRPREGRTAFRSSAVNSSIASDRTLRSGREKSGAKQIDVSRTASAVDERSLERRTQSGTSSRVAKSRRRRESDFPSSADRRTDSPSRRRRRLPTSRRSNDSQSTALTPSTARTFADSEIVEQGNGVCVTVGAASEQSVAASRHCWVILRRTSDVRSEGYETSQSNITPMPSSLSSRATTVRRRRRRALTSQNNAQLRNRNLYRKRRVAATTNQCYVVIEKISDARMRGLVEKGRDGCDGGDDASSSASERSLPLERSSRPPQPLPQTPSPAGPLGSVAEAVAEVVTVSSIDSGAAIIAEVDAGAERDGDLIAMPPPPAPPAIAPVANPARRRTRDHQPTHGLLYNLAIRFARDTVNRLAVYNLGRMNQTCIYCGALYFSSEQRGEVVGEYQQCCRRGLVRLPSLVACPLVLRDLVTNQADRQAARFRDNIRYVNNNFAMASFKCQTPVDRNDRPGGNWCFWITGQVYHYTHSVPVTNEDALRYNQLYFIDVGECVERRCLTLRDRVDPRIVLGLEQMLRETNPLVRSFEFVRDGISDMPIEQKNEVRIAFKEHINADLRRFSLPASDSEIAAIFVGEDPPFEVDMVVYPKNPPAGKSNTHNNMNPLTDPMVYPLLFPGGDRGHDTSRSHVGQNLETTRFSRVTFREHYRYRIAVREGFSLLHHGGKLYQQYLVDAWVKTESNELWYIRQNQTRLRVENYRALREFVDRRAENRGVAVGNLYVIPSNRVGTPRYMHRRYLEGMAIMARFGKPDLFVTFTTNPKWPEILENVPSPQKVESRPDVVCRVFHAKFKHFLEQVVDMQVLGVVLSYSYVIEFQKRGLPHAHCLFTMVAEDSIVDARSIDRIITAELPDETADPLLLELVAKAYIHRPCGPDRPYMPCMKDGRCTKRYPKEFNEATVYHGTNNYPTYRRSNDGRFIIIWNERIDNRSVVPYNRYCAKKFNCHINFEACTSFASLKYIHKYCAKGTDCASILATEEGAVYEHNEVQRWQDRRYVSATEAYWRLGGFPLTGRSHAVTTLPVHLEDDYDVYFDEARLQDDDETFVDEVAVPRTTKLLAWFELNRTDAAARAFKYADIPENYVWNNRASAWQPRKIFGKMLGLLMTVNPANVELFHLRVLLLHARGSTSYADLRTHRGTLHDTYQEACKAKGLVEDLREYELCLRDMIEKYSCKRVLRLFATICTVVDAPVVHTLISLWQKFKKDMAADYLRRPRVTTRMAEDKCLKTIRYYLRLQDRELADFGLPEPTSEEGSALELLDEFEMSDDDEFAGLVVPELDHPDVRTLTVEQKLIFEAVMAAVRGVPPSRSDTVERAANNLFYVDGPGGTGKTYLYNVILRAALASNVPVVSMAWTGVAATLLLQGKTVHRSFALPLSLDDATVAGRFLSRERKEQMRRVKLIVWDEAPMAPVHALAAIDRFLRDLMRKPHAPMGGKVLLMGGDFRQVMPIVKHASAASALQLCIKTSPLWESTVQFRLTRNLRAGPDSELYSDWLLDLGEGKLPRSEFPPANADYAAIPPNVLVPDRDALVQKVFGDFSAPDERFYMGRAILCPYNAGVRELNSAILRKLLPDVDIRTYYSIDSYEKDERDDFEPTQDLLHSLNAGNLPPHELELKLGAIVMLLANLNISAGLCNGTRLKVVALHDFVVEGEIVSENHRGDSVLIPRIKMTAQGIDVNLPNPLHRFQFPIKLAFALTINKAQGQTFEKVGVCLTHACFAHGQLYVAFSRVGDWKDVSVFMPTTAEQGAFECPTGEMFTPNVVERQVLSRTIDPIALADMLANDSLGTPPLGRMIADAYEDVPMTPTPPYESPNLTGEPIERQREQVSSQPRSSPWDYDALLRAGVESIVEKGGSVVELSTDSSIEPSPNDVFAVRHETCDDVLEIVEAMIHSPPRSRTEIARPADRASSFELDSRRTRVPRVVRASSPDIRVCESSSRPRSSSWNYEAIFRDGVESVIESRRSVAGLRDDSPPNDEVLEIVEAMIHSPPRSRTEIDRRESRANASSVDRPRRVAKVVRAPSPDIRVCDSD